MAQVGRYQIVFYGTSDGYKNSRAVIHLSDDLHNPIGYIQFHDPGMPFPDDTDGRRGEIIMHLPSSMLENVVDVLRNEKPVFYVFSQGHGALASGQEPVGEGE